MSKKKPKKPRPESGTLFNEEDLVSRAEVDRIPDNALNFNVPVRPLTIRILKKYGNAEGFGSDLMKEALERLNEKTQQIEGLPRTWLGSAQAYLGPWTKNKGGMQNDLTKIWSDFRPFWVKVKREDGL